MFVRTEFQEPPDMEYLFALVTKGPFRAVSISEITGVVRIEERRERLLQERVVQTPLPAVFTKEGDTQIEIRKVQT